MFETYCSARYREQGRTSLTLKKVQFMEYTVVSWRILYPCMAPFKNIDFSLFQQLFGTYFNILVPQYFWKREGKMYIIKMPFLNFNLYLIVAPDVTMLTMCYLHPHFRFGLIFLDRIFQFIFSASDQRYNYEKWKETENIISLTNEFSPIFKRHSRNLFFISCRR